MYISAHCFLRIGYLILSLLAGTGLADTPVATDIWEILDLLRPERTPPSEIERVRMKLNNIPDWEERLGKTIAELAVKGRYDGAINRVRLELDKYWDGQNLRAMTPEQERRFLDLDKILNAEERKQGAADGPRIETYTILERLQKLSNSRAVALIGPLLAERGATSDYRDSSIPSVQENAMDALIDMERYGFNPPGSPGGISLEAWCQWWAKVRKGSVLRVLQKESGSW